MSLLFWIIPFSLLGGALSALAASLLLLLSSERLNRWMPGLVSLAIGALLGAAFVGLLPHAVELMQSRPQDSGGDLHALGLTILFGILLFFTLEKMVLWRHSHDHGHDHGDHGHITPVSKGGVVAILFGDAVHNVVDGLLIGAAFLADIHLGIMTSLAVAAHELPQEMGDFVILLHSGMKPLKALLLNLAASLTTVAGALFAYFSLAVEWLPYALAIAAASFIYVAVADLIPSLQRRTGFWVGLGELGLIVLGILAICLAHFNLHM